MNSLWRLLRLEFFGFRLEIFLNTSLKNFPPPAVQKFSEATATGGRFESPELCVFEFNLDKFGPNFKQSPSFLTVSASRVSAEDMRYIASLRASLVFLRLDSCEIEEESIPLLSGLKLRSFELCDHPTSSRWVKVIASMQSLEELHLWHISDFRSYAQMLPNLPKLKVLTLHDVKLTSEDIAAFKKMKSLERMFVDDEYKDHPEIQKLVTSQMDPVEIYENSESGGRPYILIERTGSF